MNSLPMNKKKKTCDKKKLASPVHIPTWRQHTHTHTHTKWIQSIYSFPLSKKICIPQTKPSKGKEKKTMNERKMGGRTLFIFRQVSKKKKKFPIGRKKRDTASNKRHQGLKYLLLYIQVLSDTIKVQKNRVVVGGCIFFLIVELKKGIPTITIIYMGLITGRSNPYTLYKIVRSY